MKTFVTMLALVLGVWRPCAAQIGRAVQANTSCTMLEVELATSDSIIASVPLARCEAAQLVIVGVPRRLPTVPDNWIPGRNLEISVALKNTDGRPLAAPIEMEADSLTPVQNGRQLHWWYGRSYVEPVVWPGSNPPTWRFSRASDSTRAIPNGERSQTQIIRLTVKPLTQKFRLWLTIRRAGQRREYAPVLGRTPDTRPLGPDVAQFIAAARLPKLRSQTALFRVPEQDLVLFSVTYGEPHDCPSGCFYSGALGMKYGSRIGWLRIEDYDDRSRRIIGTDEFPLVATDAYLFSRAFLDTLHVHFGQYSHVVDYGVVPHVLKYPEAPRELLLRYVKRLYAGMADQAGLLESLPRVREDPGLLTLLANLPEGGQTHINARNNARSRLLALGPSLVADPATSARTLFVLAGQLRQSDSSNDAMVQSLIDHPNAKENIAILALLSKRDTRAHVRMMTLVRASEQMLRMLDEHLRTPAWRYAITAYDAALFNKAKTEQNEDVLLVLANASTNYNVASDATRLLRETDLKILEPDYVPRH